MYVVSQTNCCFLSRRHHREIYDYKRNKKIQPVAAMSIIKREKIESLENGLRVGVGVFHERENLVLVAQKFPPRKVLQLDQEA